MNPLKAEILLQLVAEWEVKDIQRKKKKISDIFAGFKDGKGHVHGAQSSLKGLKATPKQQQPIIKSRIMVVDYMNKMLKDFSETCILSYLIMSLEWYPQATTKPSVVQNLVLCDSQDVDLNLII